MINIGIKVETHTETSFLTIEVKLNQGVKYTVTRSERISCNSKSCETKISLLIIEMSNNFKMKMFYYLIHYTIQNPETSPDRFNVPLVSKLSGAGIFSPMTFSNSSIILTRLKGGLKSISTAFPSGPSGW